MPKDKEEYWILQADTINGVRRIDRIPEDVILFNSLQFYNQLPTLLPNETIYGHVNMQVADRINSDYGIH